MTLSRLLEQAIITDLGKDQRIAEFPIRIHDHPGAKAGDTPTGGEPAKVVTTVSAKEASEIFGTGIKKMTVTVEIRAALAADPNIGELLDEIEAAVSERLEPSYAALLPDDATGREDAFSGPQHKVFGITADGVARSESNLERIRVVSRTFIATILPLSSTPTPPAPGKIAHGVRQLLSSHAYISAGNSNLTRAEVNGFRLRLSWADLEPTDAGYTFTDLATSIALANTNGKNVGLGVGAGINCPDWLEAKGAIFHDVSIKGVASREPWPWDPVYQSYWARFVGALAAQFETNAKLVYLVMGGFGQGFGCDVVQTPEDIAAFTADGGLTAWATAGHTTAAMFAAAFPTTPLILQLNSPIPNNDGKNALSAMVTYLSALYPRHVGYLWEAWVTDSSPNFGSTKIITQQSPTHITVLQQEGSAAGGDFGDLSEGIANLVNLGPPWSLEVYNADLIDANTSLWVAAGNILRSSY